MVEEKGLVVVLLKCFLNRKHICQRFKAIVFDDGLEKKFEIHLTNQKALTAEKSKFSFQVLI